MRGFQGLLHDPGQVISDRVQIHGTPAEVRRSAYAQLMRHATDGRFTLDLEQTRLDDISQTWELLKTGSPRKLVVIP